MHACLGVTTLMTSGCKSAWGTAVQVRKTLRYAFLASNEVIFRDDDWTTHRNGCLRLSNSLSLKLYGLMLYLGHARVVAFRAFTISPFPHLIAKVSFPIRMGIS